MIDKHIIRFNLKGRNVRPDSVGMGELGDLLKYLEAAIRAAIPPEERTSLPDPTAPIASLVEVREGSSSDMGVATLEVGALAVGEISQAIALNSFDIVPKTCHEHLHEIFKWTVRTRRTLEIEANERFDIQHAMISRHHPIPSPVEPETKVDSLTTIYGYLQQAGGKKPRAFLEFPDGKRVTITADEQVTKTLGERLYEDVGIEGVATWIVPSWKMVAFRAIRVLEYRPNTVDLVDVFRQLGMASEGRWDGVDAARHVDELRGEASQ